MSDPTTTEPTGPQSPISPDGPQSPQAPQSPQSPQPQAPQAPGPPQPPAAQSPPPEPRPEACPNCGAHADPGQIACLDCGSRLKVRYRKPPSWRLPAAIVAGVLVLLLIGGGFAVREVASEAEIESTKESAPTAEEQQPPADGGPTTGAATGPDAATPPSATGESQPPEANPSAPPAAGPKSPAPRPQTIQQWPAGATGWTAVLVSTETRAGARAKAREALGRGIPAGVLRSGDFSSLKPGFWVVFAGRSKSEAKGDQLAAGYAGKGFPGAYSRFVKK